MKKFKDFQETRQKMSAQEFEPSTNSSVETQDFKVHPKRRGIDNVYVYMDYYYIDISNSKNIGYASSCKKYGLLLYNQYFQSDSLKELEVKLYNDWFIDNVEGNDEWMYEVGIFTPHQSGLYYKMFSDMNFNVEDITYSNDIVDTLRLSWGTLPICDVLLPNSATQDLDNEKFDTFNVIYLDKDGERLDGTMCRDGNWEATNKEGLFGTIDELEDGLIEWFHQMARDYMGEVIDFIGENTLVELPKMPMSLDEFLLEYEENVDDIDTSCGIDNPMFRRGKHIVSLHENFKPLEDWYKFGCEPKNMFEDGVEDEDIMGSFDKEGDAINDDRIIGGDEREGFGEDDATREFEECQSIVSVSRESIEDYQGSLCIDKDDNIVCDKCGNVVMTS